MAEDPGYSIVEYMSDHSGYRCGYCKSKDTNYSHGMWAHKMSVQDYQDLIDRGWRRSGKYCYKPTLNKTCCPQYTIRCDALNFRLSKSQKKVLKRVHAYLSYGKRPNSAKHSEDIGVGPHEVDLIQPKRVVEKEYSEVRLSTDGGIQKEDPTKGNFGASSKNLCLENSQSGEERAHKKKSADSLASGQVVKNVVKAGVGQDFSKPPCKKAKLQRKERRATKLASLQNDGNTQRKCTNANSRSPDHPRSLEEYLNDPMPDSPAHRLEFRLVPVNSRDPKFATTFSLSYGVFRDYQMNIHHDPPDECEESSFKNFLVDTPLTPWKPSHGPPQGYGPFHQQYWLDGKLIAVGVVDILPIGISSVYLYYDPQFSFLSLGTYSSLREIAMTRQLHLSCPDIRWYYMGFYIHSCPKMRYKGNYAPSFLLCPETYSWVAISKCVPKLNVNKYSRFSDDSQATEEATDISKVRCLFNGRVSPYRLVQNVLQSKSSDDEVREYLSLAGAKVAASILLYRS